MSSERIILDHGSGGRLSQELIARYFVPRFSNPMLDLLDDGAVFDLDGQRLAFSTDSYTVTPIFFPGGDIGDLAINGTVNDLAMCGATPLYLSAGMIIEEGFPLADLEKILASMQAAAAEAGVTVVTGDTKVVPQGACDGIFINTAGVGRVPEGVSVSGHKARPGDRVILSGYMADHGVTILSEREGLGLTTGLTSDSAPLNHMVAAMLGASSQIRVLRDPTRGGVATTLNEIALQSQVGIIFEESLLPLKEEVRGACEILGLDPLYLANEGKLLAVVGPKEAEAVLQAMQKDPHGRRAAVIGEVTDSHPGRVFMKTVINTTRVVDMLSGEPLPRIC
ncbi:MAG: hydrogenase expression/formation protein HypE [Desulfarculaceae bacterium]|jgi:hydrogenase expression/formation protein HypE